MRVSNARRLMAALLAAAALPGAPAMVNAPAVVQAQASSKALPADTRRLHTRAERLIGMPLVFSRGHTPPWINQHGYLLRSLRRNVHRGGNRA